MSILETKVGELVSQDYRTAHLFTRHKIDFCCGGGVTLEKAIEKAGAKVEVVVQEIESLKKEGNKLDLVAGMSLVDLTYHIEKVHHGYIREVAPLLQTYSEKMLRTHGERHSEIKPFYNLVSAMLEDLSPHLMKEEQVLFPAIRALASKDDTNPMASHIHHPIQAMENEHIELGNILKELEKLTDNFRIPEYACRTWSVCYTTLAEFVDDLYRHIHLENNVLFLKVKSEA
jgi:regulator of cell morphogenesis and NO signaling